MSAQGAAPERVLALQAAGAAVRPARPSLAAQIIKRYKLPAISLLFLVVVTLLALLAPWIAPYDPMAIEMMRTVDGEAQVPPFPPSADHWFGTDQLGRDLYSRVLFALRTSLFVGVVVRGGAMLVGVTVGLAAGFYPGLFSGALMRVTDLMMAFPPLLIAMAVTAVLDPSLGSVVVALVIVGWPDVARLVYGQTLAVRTTDYVLAARAVGTRSGRIVTHHVLRNTAGPIIVAFSMGIPGAIMYEAGLSFFGFGIQPPTPSLGSIISDGRGYMTSAPWYTLAPGLVLVAVVLAFNFLGDGLIDMLDPRSERQGRYR